MLPPEPHSVPVIFMRSECADMSGRARYWFRYPSRVTSFDGYWHLYSLVYMYVVVIPGAAIDTNRHDVQVARLAYPSRGYASITNTRVVARRSREAACRLYYSEHAYRVLALTACNYAAKRHDTFSAPRGELSSPRSASR